MSVIEDPYKMLVSAVSARLAASVSHGASGRRPRNREP